MTGEAHRSTPYRITIDAVTGRVGAAVDQVPVADTARAMVLRETYKRHNSVSRKRT